MANDLLHSSRSILPFIISDRIKVVKKQKLIEFKINLLPIQNVSKKENIPKLGFKFTLCALLFLFQIFSPGGFCWMDVWGRWTSLTRKALLYFPRLPYSLQHTSWASHCLRLQTMVSFLQNTQLIRCHILQSRIIKPLMSYLWLWMRKRTFWGNTSN